MVVKESLSYNLKYSVDYVKYQQCDKMSVLVLTLFYLKIISILLTAV